MSQSTSLIVKTPLETFEFHFGSRELAHVFGLFTPNKELSFSGQQAVDRISAVFALFYPDSSRSIFLSSLAIERADMISHLSEQVEHKLALGYTAKEMESARQDVERQLHVTVRLHG